MKSQDRINLSKKITTSGDYIYIASAPTGVALASASWQVKKIDLTDEDNIRITWADGNDLFDNVATDPTVLTYI